MAVALSSPSEEVSSRFYERVGLLTVGREVSYPPEAHVLPCLRRRAVGNESDNFNTTMKISVNKVEIKIKLRPSM